MYLLYSKRFDVYYVGVTNNLQRRVEMHNLNAGAKFTRGRGPWRVEAVRVMDSHSQALREERRVKRMSREKKITYFTAEP